jgi:hypothetical protein
MANFASLLKKAFPFISAAASFGGPLGTMAANAVGQALGMNKPPDSSPDAIGQVIAGATQDQINALKQIEADLQTKLLALNIQGADDLLGLDNADRADARARQIALKDKLPPILAILITIGFFGLLAVITFYGVNTSSHDVIMTMVGTLGTAWISVVVYYFGSSAGSARKTEILANGNGSH